MRTDGYRAYIDGLRALAIIAVVAYHAGLPLFRGGFVGVDVFFVISGYLITGILVREIEKTGRIDFVAFFARRIRRLFPSLILVLWTTLVLARFFLSPLRREVQETARAALATSIFSSNIYFAWWLKDYFGGPADFQPLLHTWSLSVEEQFYLVWPLIMYVIARLSLRPGSSLRRRVGVGMALISIASLAASLILSRSRPDLVFFWMPFRAWELGLGALLSVWEPAAGKSAPRTGGLLGIAGLLAIAISFVVTRAGSYFPAPLALIPALGTSLVIVGHKLSPGGLVERGLSPAPLVYVGKASYVWYLWHYPLISIGKLVFLEASLTRDLGIGALSFALAALTVEFFEDPLRFRILAEVKSLRVIGLGAALTGLSVAAALGTGSWAKAVATALPAKDADAPEGGPTVDAEFTRWDGSQERLFVFGDSHAQHLLPGLMDWARRTKANINIVPLLMSACVPVEGVTPYIAGYRKPECVEASKSLLTQLRAALPAPGEAARGHGVGVVLGSRWTMYLAQANVSVYEPWQGRIDVGVGNAEAAANLLTERLRALLTELTAHSVRTVIVLSPPELKFDLGKCLLRLPPKKCATTRLGHLDHQRRIKAIMTQLASEFPDNLRIFDPTELFCPSEDCRVELDGAPLYADSNHLSPGGSRYIGQGLGPLLRWSLGGT